MGCYPGSGSEVLLPLVSLAVASTAELSSVEEEVEEEAAAVVVVPLAEAEGPVPVWSQQEAAAALLSSSFASDPEYDPDETSPYPGCCREADVPRFHRMNPWLPCLSYDFPTGISQIITRRSDLQTPEQCKSPSKQTTLARSDAMQRRVCPGVCCQSLTGSYPEVKMTVSEERD